MNNWNSSFGFTITKNDLLSNNDPELIQRSCDEAKSLFTKLKNSGKPRLVGTTKDDVKVFAAQNKNAFER